MSLAAKLRRAPGRIVTGAFILNAGLSKFKAEQEMAKAVHGMAAGAYPVLQKVPPTPFVRGLAVAETSLGTALLLPIVPARLAGLGLMAFSGNLLGMWWRTEGMHDGVRPTQQGTAIAKDVWMFGIGTGLLVDSIVGDVGDSHSVRKANRHAAKAERKAHAVERKQELKANVRSAKKAARKAAKSQTGTVRGSAMEQFESARDAAKDQYESARKSARKQAKAANKRAKSARRTAESTLKQQGKVAGKATRPAQDKVKDAVGATRSAADSLRSSAESAAATVRSSAESAASSAHKVADKISA